MHRGQCNKCRRIKGVAVAAGLIWGWAVLSPAFGAWTYNGKTLTDGDWTFNCTASGTSLTLGTVATVGSAEKTIDLTDVEGGYSVVTIGKNALTNTKIVKVILPNTVTSIGEAAFGSNTGLREVVLSESLTTIGNGAFQSCTALTNVVPFLPPSVTSIGTRAFRSSGILNDLVITGSNLTSLPGEAGYGIFQACKLRRVDLSGSAITAIGSRTFDSCSNLAEVRLPDGLESIGSFAFAACTSLTNIVPFLPASISSIGNRTFYQSPIASPLRISSPTFVDMPSENTSYGPFMGTKIPSADFSGSGMKSIGMSNFNGISTLTNVVLSDVLESVGALAFFSCTKLQSVTPCFPPTLKSIGARAFNSCPITNDLVVSNPEFTTLPTDSSYGVFRGCRLASVDFSGSGLATIGTYAFHDNTTMTNAVLPKTLTEVGGNAFYNCSALKDIYFLSLDKPTFGSKAFSATPGDYKARFRYPATGRWQDGRTANFKPWDDTSITAANRQTYADTFKDDSVPAGIDKFDSVIKCMVPVIEDVGDRVDMSVYAEPDLFETPDPDYGDYEDVGAVAGTAPQYGDNGHDWGESVGYRIDTLVDGAWSNGVPVMGERSVSYTPEQGGNYRLTWLWTVIGHRIVVSAVNEDLGSVSLSPAGYGDCYYATNAEAVITATAKGDAVFDSWYGDVPAGHERDNPLRLKGDMERNVAPYFRQDWFYDGSATISDGNWEIKVSGSGGQLSVTGVKTASICSTLDLAKPIRDANGATWTIGTIESKAFQSRTDITEVRLPDTLTSIAEYAFNSCGNLKRIVPFLPPSVTDLGVRAFLNSPVESPLRISNPNFTSLPSENASYGVFMGTKIPSADLSGSGLRDLGMSNFSGLTTLTNLVLSDVLEIIGSYCFQSCTALKTVTPFLPSKVSAIGVRAFYADPITNNLTLACRDLVNLPTSAGYGVFLNSQFEVADLSRGGITNVGANAFAGNDKLKKVLFPKTLVILDDLAFDCSTALMDVSFRSNPSINYRLFRNGKGLPSRATFPKGDAGWMKRIADAGTGFHPWSSATAAETNAYLANFPARPVPLGYMSIGGVNKWLVPVSEGGMRVLFR